MLLAFLDLDERRELAPQRQARPSTVRPAAAGYAPVPKCHTSFRCARRSNLLLPWLELLAIARSVLMPLRRAPLRRLAERGGPSVQHQKSSHRLGPRAGRVELRPC